MIEVYGNRLLVKVEDMKEKLPVGVEIPDQTPDKSQIAEVLAVGSGFQEKIKKGDRVLYAKYGLIEVEYDGQKSYVLDGEDVIGKVE